MAALLRFGAARACRILSAYGVRNTAIYQRNSPSFYKESILKACHPSVSGCRYLSDDISASADPGETFENSTEGEIAAEDRNRSLGWKDRPSLKRGGDFQYQRQVRQLGTLVMKPVLLRVFKEILHREGGISSLQAYQVLRNCGSELLYEKPESRVELAHHFWDQFMEIGVKPDVMLYNALLSVYIQNNHNFNPLEVLEKMEKNTIEPNRTTLLLLMQGYAQKGDIAGAFKVLEFIKAAQMPLTEQVFAALITAYGFNGDRESARGVFDLMRENGLEPDLDSYTALLAMYGEAGDMESIMKTVNEMQEKRVYPNRKVFLSVLDSLSKRGHLGPIRDLLQTPIVRTLVEGDLKDLMLAVATRGEINSAFIFLGHMAETGGGRRTPLKPEFALLKQVILSGQPIDIILVTIHELEKLGAFRNVYEDALDLTFDKKNPEITLAVLQEMLQKKLRVRTHYFYPLLAMYANNENAKGAQELVNLMGDNGFEMDGTTLRYLVKSYGNPDADDVESFINLSQDVPVSKYMLTTMASLVMTTGQLDKLLKTVEYAKQEGINLLCISDAFGQYLAKKNFDPRNAVQIVKLLDSLDATLGLSNVIVKACEKCSQREAITRVEFVTLLLKEGLNHLLESRTFTFVMSSLTQNKMTTEFYEFVRVMKESKVTLDEHHYRQLIKMMAFDGKAEAAQFCFEKAAKLAEPTDLMYSYLLLSYAHCSEGGIYARVPKDRNMKRICQLYNEMWSRGLRLTARAKGAACIAHLMMGDLEKAEEIRSTHGIGVPRYRVLSEFLKSYSKRGDVAKSQELYEELKEEMKNLTMPTFVYNSLLHVYGFHGDIDSQWKIFEEMKKNNVEPNQFSYSNIIRTYLHKDDIDTALKIFQDAKEQGKFISDATCLLLLNSMARTGQLEHFESALEDIMTNRVASAYSMKWGGLLRGMVFCCLHAGKKDLALKIQLEHEVRLEIPAFVAYAENSAKRGEVDAVLNAIEFFKENDINPAALYLPLIKAYDARKDPASVKALYDKLVAEGVELDESFLQNLNHILLKYSETVPFEVPTQSSSPSETQTLDSDSENLNEDEESNVLEDINKDIQKEDDLK
ncbi:uncharacterized protein [Porites lutea]|uniref:uncharacterized protein n=1 Tax=Porites lutea TaxID=51062 RepID=UPI003CC549BA